MEGKPSDSSVSVLHLSFISCAVYLLLFNAVIFYPRIKLNTSGPELKLF